MKFVLYGNHHFETLHGHGPNRLLDGHPHDSLVIMQASAENFTGRSAVWNTQTGKIVWAPPDAYMMAWCHDGKEIGVMCEQDAPPSAAIGNQAPARGWERVSIWKRYSWPSLQLLSSYPFPSSADALYRLVISPRSDLAVCHWESSEQEILSFIVLSQKGDVLFTDLPFPSHEQLIELRSQGSVSGYLFEPYTVTSPVFSPNGRYLVIGWEKKWHWWPGPREDDDFEVYDDGETAWEEIWKPPEGDCHFGSVAVFDWDTHQIRTISITASIPSGWIPPGWGQDAAEMRFGAPVFLDSDHFRLRLPTGEQQVYNIPAADEM